MRGRIAATITTILVLSFAGVPAQAHAGRAEPGPGSPGVGDTYYPDYGNGGYDVSHYDIRLRYDPSTDRLSGTTTVLAMATQDLSRFNLDFLLDVSSVRVNGWTASFAKQDGHELVITPPRPVLAGRSMTVVVTYSGIPSNVKYRDATSWTRTSDGALAVNQPEISWWWYPSNDHPTDKATYDIAVLVPNGVEVISNGIQPMEPRPELIGWTRWSWRMSTPIASYLAFLAIGQYEIVTDEVANGQPIITAYSQNLGDLAPAARASVDRTAEIIEWLASVLGSYPYQAQGGVVGPQDGIRFALETATRPVYGWRFWQRGSNPYVIVHELAHQWYGDSVSVAQWKDIWLNEGFATYVEWLWAESVGEGTAQELADFTYASYPANDPFWQVLPGDPGPDELFHDAVYDRGALTLHQLRLTIGDTAFFRLLRDWANVHQHGNGTMAQFHELAERISGKDLDALFTTWLYTAGRPALSNARTGGPAGAAGPSAAPRAWAKLRDVAALRRH